MALFKIPTRFLVTLAILNGSCSNDGPDVIRGAEAADKVGTQLILRLQVCDIPIWGTDPASTIEDPLKKPLTPQGNNTLFLPDASPSSCLLQGCHANERR